MKNRTVLLLTILLIVSCEVSNKQFNSIIISGQASSDVEYLIIKDDTIDVNDGHFIDSIEVTENQYDYIQLSTWKWPNLIYLDKARDLKINFTKGDANAAGDTLNTFLLNSDSILQPYSLRWDMNEDTFRNAITTELSINFEIIDSVLLDSGLSDQLKEELKSIEKYKVAHRTANFISFQERQGNAIDRNIYEFIKPLNLNDKRLEKQENNRNFQYYYLLDKVGDEVPDSIYPFAVIDTVNKYSSLSSIREMIIFSTVRSSFYSEEVDHHKLLTAYETNFGKSENYDELQSLYDKTQKLKPGNQAPSIGELESINEDSFTIDDLRGQNVLLTVWGTWCPYCKEELPSIKNLIDKHGTKFKSVGISFDKDEEKWKDYLEDADWKGIHLIDPNRRSTFKSNYMVSGTNVHLLIDKNGTILSTKGMKPSSKELEALIKKL